jgi:hypothetical protein
MFLCFDAKEARPEIEKEWIHPGYTHYFAALISIFQITFAEGIHASVTQISNGEKQKDAFKRVETFLND